MDKAKLKKRLKLVVQLLVAALAIYLVTGQIDLQEYKKQLLGLHPGWLMLAVLAFNGSKVLSAFRLNYFFKSLGLSLGSVYNLKLYYLGMLYNQVFPGGIGGDGYKVYLLNKLYETPVKGLITATLLDRISGVVALGFLAFITGLFGSSAQWLDTYSFLLWVGLIAAYPSYYLLVHFLFPSYKKYNHITNIQAIGVQGLQVLCAYFMLQALGIEAGYMDYFTLFLVSSVAAALPISAPGGLGVREWVMVEGAVIFALNGSAAAAFASIFFIITLFSSLLGSVFIRQFRGPDGADSNQKT
ncbi:MAG: flippase-like domain-containing protein [Roseivirga sp.]|nr:flippase-like domain-containing protein [Roseivirga sp.]